MKTPPNLDMEYVKSVYAATTREPTQLKLPLGWTDEEYIRAYTIYWEREAGIWLINAAQGTTP